MESKISEISKKLFSGVELTPQEATLVCNSLKGNPDLIDDIPVYTRDKEIMIAMGFPNTKEGKYAVVDMEDMLSKELKEEHAEDAVEHIEKEILSNWRIRRVLIGYCLGAHIASSDPLRSILGRFRR